MHVIGALKTVQRISILGVSKKVSIFPSITIAAVLLKASFVKKTLHNYLNGELKLHATGQKPVNNIGKCQQHNEIKLIYNIHQTS